MNPGKWKVNLNHRNLCYINMRRLVKLSPGFITMQGHKYTNILIFVTYLASFYLRVWSVQPLIQSLYPWMRCIYMQECSVHLLICLLFPWVQLICTCKNIFSLADTTFIQMPICLLFPWVQCQSLKPFLSQCNQTGFVTVDDFIALYTCPYIFYCHGCNKFLHARTFFTLANTINCTYVYHTNRSLAPC